MQPFEHPHTGLDQRFVILGKVAYGSFVTPDDFSAGQEWPIVAAGSAQFGLGNRGGVSQERIDQGRLARAVAAHQGNLLAANDAGRKLADDFSVPIGFVEALDFDDVFAGRPLLFELQERTLDVRLCQFSDLQAFHFLAARLHLAGSGAGREPGNKFVQLADLLFPLCVLRFDL